jgi:hypothetical protein
MSTPTNSTITSHCMYVVLQDKQTYSADQILDCMSQPRWNANLIPVAGEGSSLLVVGKSCLRCAVPPSSLSLSPSLSQL